MKFNGASLGLPKVGNAPHTGGALVLRGGALGLAGEMSSNALGSLGARGSEGAADLEAFRIWTLLGR